MRPAGAVKIDYTNFRGERKTYTILPKPGSLRFASNAWHPEPQWIIEAADLERDVERHFAVKDIHSWVPCHV